MFQQHRDREVQHKILQLADELCQYERNTGRENILIVAEKDGDFLQININGKPVAADVIRDVTVQGLLKQFMKPEG